MQFFVVYEYLGESGLVFIDKLVLPQIKLVLIAVINGQRVNIRFSGL